MDGFEYCDACSAKPGAPMLCDTCIHNQDAWGVLKRDRDHWRTMHPLRFTVIRILDVVGRAAAKHAIRIGRDDETR